MERHFIGRRENWMHVAKTKEKTIMYLTPMVFRLPIVCQIIIMLKDYRLKNIHQLP